MDAGEIKQMKAPFDVQDLIDRLRVNGIVEAEKIAKIVANQSLNWAKDSCAISPSMMLRLMGPMLEAARPSILASLDKIDGRLGN